MSSIRTSKANWSSLWNSTSSCKLFSICNCINCVTMTTSFNLAHVYILLSNTTIFLVHLNHQSMCGHNHTPHPPSYFLINEPQYVTLPYKYKCFTFSRGFPYQYITTNYNFCRICLCICIQKFQIDTLVLHSCIPICVMKGAPHGVTAQLRINSN
jgi:hypothetical protein